jgi:transcription initiation factor TFIIIB Brf1 subunit/transcription initiation factor TFIIB
MTQLLKRETFVIVSSDSEDDLLTSEKKGLGKTRAKRSVRTRNAPLSIERDFAEIELPNSIKEKACEIAEREGFEPRKSRPKVKQMYMCIRFAHAELGLPCDPQHIARMLNMSLKEINSAETTYNEATTGYAPPEVEDIAENYIPFHLENIGVAGSFTKEINKLLSQLLHKEPDLRNVNPLNLAAAAIVYYFRIKSLVKKSDEAKDLIIRMNRPVAAMTTLIKRLESIHNNE